MHCQVATRKAHQALHLRVVQLVAVVEDQVIFHLQQDERLLRCDKNYYNIFYQEIYFMLYFIFYLRREQHDKDCGIYYT